MLGRSPIKFRQHSDMTIAVDAKPQIKFIMNVLYRFLLHELELFLTSTKHFWPDNFIFEPPRGKTNNVVFEQVRHKPACTSTEKS